MSHCYKSWAQAALEGFCLQEHIKVDFYSAFLFETCVGALTLQCLSILWIRSISDFPFSSEAAKGCAGCAWQSCCKQQAKLWASRRCGGCPRHKEDLSRHPVAARGLAPQQLRGGVPEMDHARGQDRLTCLVSYSVKNCSNVQVAQWHLESTELRASPELSWKATLVGLFTCSSSDLRRTLLPWDFLNIFLFLHGVQSPLQLTLSGGDS